MRKADLIPAAILLSCSFVALLTIVIACSREEIQPESADRQVLLLIPHGYGANYYLIRDVIEQYGWNVTHAGLTDTVEVCGPFAAARGATAMLTDTLVEDITDVTEYDCVAIMSSTQFSGDDPYADMLGDPKTLSLIAAAVEKGLPVFATCAGVRVLAAAGVIDGRQVIGSPRFQAEYEAAGATYLGKDRSPVIDGNIITSVRGQYNNVANGQAMATVMENNAGRGTPGKPVDREFILAHDATLGGDDVAWARTFGGLSADGGRALCETRDGGYLIAGYTFSHGAGDADILVIKTDSEGNQVWSRNFGGSGTEYGYGCAAVDDGYLVTGYTTSSGSGSKDVLLMKIDSAGNENWSRTYGGSSWDVGMSICTGNDDNYFVCGHTESFGSGEEDIYLIKTDRDGNEIWSRTYGGSLAETGNSVAVTADGGCVIGTTTATFGGGNTDMYLIKTDPEGNEVWTRPFGAKEQHGHGFDWSNRMSTTRDGGYVLVGYTDCNDLMDAFVIRTDGEGNELWSRAFGHPFYDYGSSIRETEDGTLVICGTTKSVDGNNDIFLAELDPEGNIIREMTFGGAGSDWASAAHVTKNGDCVVVGHTNSCGTGSYDVCILKTAGP